MNKTGKRKLDTWVTRGAVWRRETWRWETRKWYTTGYRGYTEAGGGWKWGRQRKHRGVGNGATRNEDSHRKSLTQVSHPKTYIAFFISFLCVLYRVVFVRCAPSVFFFSFLFFFSSQCYLDVLFLFGLMNWFLFVSPFCNTFFRGIFSIWFSLLLLSLLKSPFTVPFRSIITVPHLFFNIAWQYSHVQDFA